jgi:hypothetical protein
MSSKLDHDINSAISALINAMDLLKDEWDKNPELTDKILPLVDLKIKELKELIDLKKHI